MIKVLIADDQEIMREGLKMLLNIDNEVKIVESACNGREAYTKAKICNPDIILMDMKMPEMDGAEATALIKAELPEIKIIVLTTFNDDEYIYKSLKSGASGYLLKDANPDTIISAIKTVFHGGSIIQPDVAAKLINQFAKLANSERNQKANTDSLNDYNRIDCLTEREIKICTLLAEGLNNKEIGNSLYISEGTVKNHITNILNKLELRDRTQLAIFSVKNIL